MVLGVIFSVLYLLPALSLMFPYLSLSQIKAPCFSSFPLKIPVSYASPLPELPLL